MQKMFENVHTAEAPELNYRVPAIPTVYAGVHFRSRLEANWGAFFDLAGWKWEYEPTDLLNWTPDFWLQGEPDLLVEVKPIREFHEATAKKISQACIASNYRNEVLLLGKRPYEFRPGEANLGWLWEREHPEGGGNGWGYCALDNLERRPPEFAPGRVDGQNPILDFYHLTGSYRHRISGWYDGSTSPMCHQTAMEIWGLAQSKVQYKTTE